MNYYLAESCQNTFVLFDCIASLAIDGHFIKRAHQILQKEKRDDALILVKGEEKNASLIVQMIVLGLDGEIAEFCGNGARCVAAYLFKTYPQFKPFFIRSNQGLFRLSHLGGHEYSIQLPLANFTYNPKFISDPKRVPSEWTYVEVGEPHLIIQKNLSEEALFQMGQNLNQQKEVFPFGINVNAWHVLEKGHIFVKTYERGVQRLTKSCGSGSIACASFYQKEGNIQISTPGGFLRICVSNQGVLFSGESLITDKIDCI